MITYVNYLYIYYSALQEAQDIFGIDFDYDEFGKYGEDEFEDDEDEEEDDYIHDEIEDRPRRSKQHLKKKSTKKSIFEVYEPSELIRGHFTDIDNEVIIKNNTNLSSIFINNI